MMTLDETRTVSEIRDQVVLHLPGWKATPEREG